MKALQLHDGWEFHSQNPFAEPLHVDPEKRVLRFALRPGQVVSEHVAPNSPVLIVVLHGQGLFSDGTGSEQQFGPSTLLIFEAAEKHSIRALDEDLVFVAFLHGAKHY